MKKLLIIIFLFISVFSFWKINEQNYTKQKEIKKELINHPENLPKSDIAKITSF
jgi:dipeptide/tripeptide permease